MCPHCLSGPCNSDLWPQVSAHYTGKGKGTMAVTLSKYHGHSHTLSLPLIVFQGTSAIKRWRSHFSSVSQFFFDCRRTFVTMRRSHDPTYPLYPILSFLGFVVCLIPLPWHIQAWNSGTCAFMIWTAISCLIGFVNSLVWTGNVNNLAPVWCDICE